MRHLLIALATLLILPIAVHAEKRVGLVIGNDLYSEVAELNKAAADAEAVSDALRAQGFQIVTVLNAPRRDMNRKLSEFTALLEPGDTAFVFFAGHGVEIDGENYLLPTDIVAPDSGDQDFVKAEAISLSRLLDRVRATGVRTTVAVIDACRNNPFQERTGRSIGSTRGLGRINAPEGTFVIFSAGAGQLALDELSDNDTARNSVFTRQLLPRLSTPGLELRDLMAEVRVDVRNLARTVNHEQFPAYYDELLGDFYFTRAAASVPPIDEAVADVPPAPSANRMREDFEFARALGSRIALEEFVERYSDQSDDISYAVALKLLESMPAAPDGDLPARSSETVVSQPAPAPVPVPTPTDRRQMLRASQVALNRAGCDAGTADGVVGPRTRRAFAQFIKDTGAALAPGDLGSDMALRLLEAAGPGACKARIASPTAPSESPAASPAANRMTLAGRWNYKATCALLIKVTGTVRFRSAGGNRFDGSLSDSLGQKANSEVYLNDQEITGTDYFPGIVVKWRGRMAADGKSYTASGSTGCSVYAWRVG